MEKLIDIKNASIKWGVTTRRISSLCREGKIEGAIKVKGEWQIPSNSQKPSDGRIRSGKFIQEQNKVQLPLPIGVTDYPTASTEYYYVDKTLMIKEFIDELPAVSLFTRPRRFGKTLNMDMFRTFFEKTNEDTSIYFKNKKIWSCGKKYQSHQGKYPVIYLSFKDIKHKTWNETFESLFSIIHSEYVRHNGLKNSENLDASEKEFYDRIISRHITNVELEQSLFKLSVMLKKHYKEGTVIIIDEYDTPIQSGYINSFYDDVISFMRNLLSGCLKDNKNLKFGLLTGILRVSKESIFSGLNNITINSVLDSHYSEYFGFTTEEVKEMAHYYNADDKLNEICEWYDGYRFGNTDIFNPWSILNYFRNKCQPQPYWISTSSNDIIVKIISEANGIIYSKLEELIQSKTIATAVDLSVVYPDITNNPSVIFSFLLVAGYLKTIKINYSYSGKIICELAIPNKEILYVYGNEILNKFSNIIPEPTSISILENLSVGNADGLKDDLNTILIQSVSFYDTMGENFYHGMVLGLCTAMDNMYYVSSNRESGEGRFDLCLEPKLKNLPGIIIELKAIKETTADQLKSLSDKAVQQISNNHYDTFLKSRGITTILKYGVAFSGKNVSVSVSKEINKV